jgi:hypothetical protein
MKLRRAVRLRAVQRELEMILPFLQLGRQAAESLQLALQLTQALLLAPRELLEPVSFPAVVERLPLC